MSRWHPADPTPFVTPLTTSQLLTARIPVADLSDQNTHLLAAPLLLPWCRNCRLLCLSFS